MLDPHELMPQENRRNSSYLRTHMHVCTHVDAYRHTDTYQSENSTCSFTFPLLRFTFDVPVGLGQKNGKALLINSAAVNQLIYQCSHQLEYPTVNQELA